MPNIIEKTPESRKQALKAIRTLGNEKSDILFFQILWLSENFGLVDIDGYVAVKGFWECDCATNFVHYLQKKCEKCGVKSKKAIPAELQFVLAELPKYLKIGESDNDTTP